MDVGSGRWGRRDERPAAGWFEMGGGGLGKPERAKQQGHHGPLALRPHRWCCCWGRPRRSGRAQRRKAGGVETVAVVEAGAVAAVVAGVAPAPAAEAAHGVEEREPVFDLVHAQAYSLGWPGVVHRGYPELPYAAGEVLAEGEDG